MKILFFLALIVNIIVFLWEYNSGVISSVGIVNDINNNKEKQILLVKELSIGEKVKPLIQAKNEVDSFDTASFSEVDTVSDNENKEIDKLVKEPSNLVISKDYNNKIVLKPQAFVEDKVDKKELEQGFLNSDAIKTVEQKTFNTVQNTGGKQNFVTNAKLNPTDKTIAKIKSIVVKHQIKNTSIQSVANKSLTKINKKLSTDEIDKELTKQQISIKGIDNNREEDKPLVISKDLIKEPLTPKKIGINAKEKQVQVIVNPPRKISEVKSPIKTSETNDVSSKASLLGSVNVTIQKEKLNIEDTTAPNAKIINKNKVQHQKVLQEKTKIIEPLNTQCYDVGPFQSPAVFEVWRKQNKIDLASIRMLKKNRSKASSFLVYYPPAKNFSESKKNLQILKRMGITDYWLFLKGEFKGAISLGLFTKESRALRFKQKLGDMGLDVKIKQRYKTEALLYTQILTEDKQFEETVVVSKTQTISDCNIQKPVASKLE